MGALVSLWLDLAPYPKSSVLRVPADLAHFSRQSLRTGGDIDLILGTPHEPPPYEMH